MINENKTLEGLDAIDYSETELNELYLNLEDLFKDKGIIIEDKPKYEKSKYEKNKYEDQIDEVNLKKIIIDRYKNKEIKDIVIDNDIDSISAIIRLREGKRVQKFEDCNAIFITSNYDLRTATKQLLKINEKIEKCVNKIIEVVGNEKGNPENLENIMETDEIDYDMIHEEIIDSIVPSENESGLSDLEDEFEIIQRKKNNIFHIAKNKNIIKTHGKYE